MKKIMKIVSLLLVLTLSVTSFPIDVLAQDNTANEISTKDDSTNKYIGDGYDVEFKVSNQWDGAFNGELVITNTGDKPLENWTLKYDFNHEITNMWNAQIISHENNTYTIKNLGWNQDIQPGSSISIGFTANYSDKITSPEKYSMLITNRVLNSNDFSVNFKVTSDWGQAFNGEITITNNTKETIEDWSLEFDFDRNIDSFWTAEILEHTGNHYVIKNAGYNANILAGQSITLGFSGNPGNVDNTPSDYKLIEICEKTDESNNEVIDSDNDGISDAEELKYGTDPNNLDTDGDGLTDYLEVYSFKTNPLVKDTDGDNLNDYDEIRCGTNPLIIDTDGNGVTDDLEDADGDRLTNYEEILFGSSPSNKDSDFDGLDDKSEKELGTDPNNLDSDNDGLFDGKEIEIGTDPLNPDSNGNGILDGDEIFTVSKTPEDKDLDKNVTPIINIPLKAAQIDTLTIEKVPEDDIFLSSDIPGYIGSGYDFTVDGTFENATLTYEFNYELLSNEDFEPRIYYFNENDQILEELENQVIEGNKVTATITHFSKYILLNKVDFDSVWKNEIKPPSSAGNVDTSVLDVALVIDSSGSMSWNDRDNLRIETSKLFIDKLRENDRACIVDFDDYTYLLSGFKNDKDVLKAALDKIDDYGGTSIYRGINKALDQFDNNGRSAVKNMIVLTDGEDNDSYNYDALLQRAKDNNIVIYTIGLGSDVDTKLLTKIATTTGGKYYNASSAGDLVDEFDKVTGETIDFVTDTDKDGISDYYEKAINEGKLRLGTGKSLKGKLNPSKSDTDGDKLKDGKEITITERGTKIYVKYTSDPTKKDTDDDGYSDYDEYKNETNPLVWDVSDRDLAIFSTLAYESESPNNLIGSLFEEDRFQGLAKMEEVKSWELGDYIAYETEDEKTERWFSASTYVESNSKNIVVSFRGSSDWMDWVGNGIIYSILFIRHPQAKEAENYIKKIVKKYSNYNIYITGHSLGGYLALTAAASVSYDDNSIIDRVATFNGLGLDLSSPKYIKEGIDNIKDKVTCYRIDNDVVSLIGSNYNKKTFDLTQEAKDKYNDDNLMIRDILRSHDMCSFYKYLEPLNRVNY